jgi:flagella basal body P-ring formation protein FlgA
MATLLLALGAALVHPALAGVAPLDPAWTAQAEALATQAARAAFGGRTDVRVQVEPGQLDPRLKLAPCEQVDIYLPAGQRVWGRMRVGLRCVQGPVAWNVYMPVNVKVFAPALLAAQPLAAGTVLQPQHLRVGDADWASSRSPIVAAASLAVGRALVHGLAAGAAVREADLKKRQWFDIGDTVRITATGNGFSVASGGVALSPGIEGQPVRVRTDHGRTVTGMPIGERRVVVAL